MENILVNDVSFSYPGHPVLSHITFQAFPEKPVALLGASGSGKTTMLRLIAGLEKPDSGQIKGASSGAAVVFQESRLIPHLTSLKNVKLVKQDLTERQITYLFDSVGLSGCENKYPDELSGGMQRRVALLRAIASGLSPLLLDEPFTGLDSETKQACIKLLEEHSRKRCLIFTTHDQSEAQLLHAKCIMLFS